MSRRMMRSRNAAAKAPLKDPQIGGKLAKSEVADLARYAASFQLTLNHLGFLLVLRELAQLRLEKLAILYNRSVPTGDQKRMTTRPRDWAVKAAFSERASLCNLGSDEAATILFRAELEEKWLMKSIHFG